MTESAPAGVHPGVHTATATLRARGRLEVGLQLGVVSPVVVAYPGATPDWERAAGPDELRLVAQTADSLGYDYLTCSEHVAVPFAEAEQRGGTYWDPLATLSWLAAHTSRIKLATQVLVLGYHHPLAIAKRYGTLDMLSGGRVVLGLGVGSLEEEFALLGAPFEDRGERADDALRALRSAMSQSEPRYAGSHYEFEGLVVEPHAIQPHVPFWIGGRSHRSLRRAVELGDGWVPFGLAAKDIAAMLAEQELPPGFDVVLSPSRPLDPGTEPDKAIEAVGRLDRAGATRIGVRLDAASVTDYCEQLQALRELVPS
jgi:probable F420-dependent oxidoreductase